jgi:hypothetical protein
MSKNSLLAVIAVLAAGLIGYALGRNTDFDLVIKYPKGETKVAVKGAQVDHQKVLNALLADEFLSGALKDWLAKNQYMFSLNDVRLASALEEKACDPIPEKPLLARLKGLTACASKPAYDHLRALALRKRGYFFHEVGVPGRASVPDENRDKPLKGTVSVCGRDFWYRKLVIINADSDTTIKAKARGIIHCSGVADTDSQLHLNPVDAEKLFGGPLRGVRSVYVSIAEEGT